MKRRDFMRGSAAVMMAAATGKKSEALGKPVSTKRPNVLFFLADEWRGQALRYAGDPNAKTPNLDALAAQSANCTNFTSGLPVCSPAKASLLTGQYPLKNGVFLNDVPLAPNDTTLGEAFKNAGYRTGYIGKWHLHGSPDGHYGRRSTYIPADQHFGFDYWKADECDHNYNHERYFVGNDPTPRFWPGYAPFAETDDACQFIESGAHGLKPFFLVLSVAPPHFPYGTAPERFKAMFADEDIKLRPNVPDKYKKSTIQSLRGYYAHIAALDSCVKHLLETLDKAGLADDTIIAFSSDHGDMLFSQGLQGKLYPWNESVSVPFLLRYPRKMGKIGRKIATPMNSPDIMPTLLGMAGLPIPAGVQGIDFSDVLITGDEKGQPTTAFINNPVSNFQLRQCGFDSYRGVRSDQYTYIRSIHGPWLLYDNVKDPFQKHNICSKPEGKHLQAEAEAELTAWLHRLHDEFLPGSEYLRRSGLGYYYEVKTPIGRCYSPWGDWGPTM